MRSGMLKLMSWLVAAAYFLLLFPVLLFGAVAFLDARDRGCPGANQCSDAAMMMTIALVYLLAAPLVWLAFKAMRNAAGSWGVNADA